MKSLLKLPLFGLILSIFLGFIVFKPIYLLMDHQVHQWVISLSSNKTPDNHVFLTYPKQLTDLEKKIRLNTALKQFILVPPKAIVLAGDWSHDTASWVTTQNSNQSLERQLLKNLGIISENTKLIAPLYSFQPMGSQPQPVTKTPEIVQLTIPKIPLWLKPIAFSTKIAPLPKTYSWLRASWQELLSLQSPMVRDYPIPLLFNKEQQFFPSLSLSLSLLGKHQALVDINDGIMLPEHSRPISQNANIWPRITAGQIKQRTLTLVEQQDPVLWKDKIVYIGTSDDHPLLQSIESQLALTSNAWDWRPEWDVWFFLGSIVFLGLLHLWVSARLTLSVNLLVTFIIMLLLFIGQMTLSITQHWWLSGNQLIFWLLVLQFVFLSQNQLIAWFDKIQYAQDDALQLLAIANQEKGELITAFGYLKRCNNSAYTCDLLYQLAQQMERKREYETAIEVYKQLQQFGSKQYKNLQGRIIKLERATSHQVTGSSDLVETMIMPKAGLQLPQIGRYNIEKVIGQGAMGIVYLGQDPKIGRSVAIKTLNLSSEFAGNDLDDAKDRFYREAETAGQLRHPNIVTIYDVGEEQGLAYIAMDFLKGRAMNEFTQPESLLPVSVVYEVIRQVAEALDYAHNQGIVHRDIKPANIIYNGDDNEVIVTDFGIACVTDNSKTRTGTILGSPYYMSPEQLEGSRVDGRADIFSLGVTFFQLLTGRLPFEGETLVALTHQIAHMKHTQLREVRENLPPSASRIINKALQKKPESRFQNAQELAQTLTMAIARI